jgi:hypothetical protein
MAEVYRLTFQWDGRSMVGHVMRITIRYVQSCPNVGEAERRIREAAALVDAEVTIDRELVASVEEAERSGFNGSPTILVEGDDPFRLPDLPGLSCRLYPTETGLEGAPSVSQLREVLRRRG